MKDFFAAYGEEATKEELPPIMVSGRHDFHDQAVSAIVDNIVAKLQPRKSGKLLEIGCGLGLLLRPLSTMVSEAVGIDHPLMIEKLASMQLPANVTLISGRFPEVEPQGTFEYVLTYSVLHYMMSIEEADRFIDACVGLLAPGGLLLIGDLPNPDASRRFQSSTEGQLTTQEYAENCRKSKEAKPEAYAARQHIEEDVAPPPQFITDEFVMRQLSKWRQKGYETYLLPQPKELPFSFTREDILIRRRM